MLIAPGGKARTRPRLRTRIVAEFVDGQILGSNVENEVIRNPVLGDGICSDLKHNSLRQRGPDFIAVRTISG